MKPRLLLLVVILVCGLARSRLPLYGQEVAPYPRITEEAFKARLPFLDYDKRIPLEGGVVREWNQDGALRRKIVYRGAQGFLVTGLVEFPKSGPKPFPLALLLHGWSGAKEDWLKDVPDALAWFKEHL